MGQYYKPIILDSQKKKPTLFASPYDFGNGAKLMEHSWMLNPFVHFIEMFLIGNPNPIVWAGDYADNEAETDRNLYDLSEDAIKLQHNEKVENKYNHNYKKIPLRFKYLVNHDKKEFIDKTKVRSDADGWRIHPLPLMTCEGNGRGGGDYRKDSPLVGSWARNVISVESRKSNIPKDFKEIKFNLVE